MKPQMLLNELRRTEVANVNMEEAEIMTSDIVIRSIRCPRSFKTDDFFEISCNEPPNSDIQ